MKIEKRNCNIEALRILLMLFIIMHHCVVHGYGLRYQLDGNLLNYTPNISYSIFLGIINSIVIIGVNVFFLISGYYGINHSLKKFTGLIIELYFYSTILNVITICLNSKRVSSLDVKNIIFPFHTYWFIYTYFLLMLVCPIINKGIEGIGKKSSINILICLLFIFSGLGMISDNLMLGINKGYSWIFAMFLYYIGRMIRKYKIFERKPVRFWGIGWLGATTMTALKCSIFIFLGRYSNAWNVFSYNQLFVVLSSICFFALFIKAPQHLSNKQVIRKLASVTLAVYYIHTAACITYYRNMPLEWLKEHNVNWGLQVVFLLAYAIFIYAVCALIGLAIRKFFGGTKQRLINLLDKKIHSLFVRVDVHLGITGEE